MTNEISIYQAFPSESEIKNMQMIAAAAYKSGLYKSNPDAIVMTLLAARELNVGPISALNGGIYNINGKIEISARLMGTLIRRAGHTIKFIENTAEKCVLQGIRADTKDTAETSFTIEEAKKAGLFKIGGGWDKWPEDMCYARALSRLGRRLFPDVIQNCYVEGEISDSKGNDKACEQLPDAEAELIEQIAPEPIKLVDGIQSHELMRLRTMLIEVDAEAFDRWIEKTYMINSLENLPLSAYEKVIKALQNKIKTYEDSKS